MIDKMVRKRNQSLPGRIEMKKIKIKWMTISVILIMFIGYFNPVEAKKVPNFAKIDT